MAKTIKGVAHFRAAAAHIKSFTDEHPECAFECRGLLHAWLNEQNDEKLDSLCRFLDRVISAHAAADAEEAAKPPPQVLPFRVVGGRACP